MNDLTPISGIEAPGHIKYYLDLVQGSDEWHEARRGLLTASEMKLILTPTLKIADNDKTRAHVYELAAQRVMKHVEPQYVGYDMLRGKDDEIEARILYDKHYAPVTDMGFITNDRWGFTLGFSPDGLVGDDGFIECKSRAQKYQFQTITENVIEETEDGEYIVGETIPDEYVLQIQTGFLVSERQWCDFVTYSNGMHMATIKVFPDYAVQDAIIRSATAFEAKVAQKIARYHAALKSKARLIPTERRIIQEMYA